MSPRIAIGKERMDISISRDVVNLYKGLHAEYNRRTGLSVSFSKFIEGVLVHYIGSDDGKKLAVAAHREFQKQD